MACATHHRTERTSDRGKEATTASSELRFEQAVDSLSDDDVEGLALDQHALPIW